MRVFGIDPGSVRTGYGCIETDGRRHSLIACGAIIPEVGVALANRLEDIHAKLAALIARHRPDCVAIENLFDADYDTGKTPLRTVGPPRRVRAGARLAF